MSLKRKKESEGRSEGDSGLRAVSQTASSLSRQSQEGPIGNGDGRKSCPEDRVLEGWLEIFFLKQELTLNSQITPHPPQEDLTRKLTPT